MFLFGWGFQKIIGTRQLLECASQLVCWHRCQGCALKIKCLFLRCLYTSSVWQPDRCDFLIIYVNACISSVGFLNLFFFPTVLITRISVYQHWDYINMTWNLSIRFTNWNKWIKLNVLQNVICKAEYMTWNLTIRFTNWNKWTTLNILQNVICKAEYITQGTEGLWCGWGSYVVGLTWEKDVLLVLEPSWIVGLTWVWFYVEVF